MAKKKLEYPKIHLGESFVDQQAQKMFGTSDLKTLNKKLMKKLDAYLASDEGRAAATTFRQNDLKKFKDSLDLWKLVSEHNSSIDQAAWRDYINKKYPLTQTIAGAGSAAGGNSGGGNAGGENSVAGGTAEIAQTDPVLTTVVAKEKQDSDWEALAKQHGFVSLDDVKAFLKKVGLDQTGLLDEPSLAKLAWYNHMKQLGYTEGSDLQGQSWFSNNDILYYNNGRQLAADGTMSNYDYKTLTLEPTTSTIPTLSDLLLSNYFRKHYNYAGNTVKIGNVEYPLVVTTGLLGSDLDVTNDHSYVFDPSTGKIRKLRETWTGNIQAFRGPEFEQNSTWIDVQPILDYKPQPKPQPTTYYNVGGRQSYLKQGGTMNRIKYFQKGGAAQQGAQDIQQQVTALVQAAIQGDEKANQTVNQIMEAAKKGDQQAVQLAQMIQAVVQQMKGQATSAKWGSKLSYIRSLKYAQGGKACPACEKGAPIKVEEKACGGKAKKAKKRYFGGWL